MNDKNDKKKMYFAIGFVMIIIITAWILNFKNNILNKKDTKDIKTNQELKQISQDFEDLIVNTKNIKNKILMSPTSTGELLQNSKKIRPEQLNEMIEKINNTTTTITTTTEEKTSLQ